MFKLFIKLIFLLFFIFFNNASTFVVDENEA